MTEKEQILQQLRNIISDAIRKINLEGQGMELDGVKAHLEKASKETKDILERLWVKETLEEQDDNR